MDKIFSQIFPHIYYFFSCIKQSPILDSSGNKVLNKKGKVIKFDEPMDAMLWYLEIKKAFDQKSALRRMDLMNFVFRWFNETTSLQRAYDKLEEAKFISVKTAREMRKSRKNEVFIWLTEEGRIKHKKVEEKTVGRMEANMEKYQYLSRRKKIA